MNHIYSECKASFSGCCAVNMHYLCNKAPLNSYVIIFISQFQLLLSIFKISKMIKVNNKLSPAQV